jgi:SAM-dependent methyltransferase
MLGDRSHASACRLNLQFYLWKEAIGFNTHPKLPVSETSIIADVATGTCAWLIDVAHQYPSAELIGFDNSLDQAPHKQWLPRNVTVKYWNIFEDVPPEFVGRFDFIHVRLLVMVIEGDPRPVLRNLLSMLKPGGYLQWDELDCVNMHVKKVDNSISAPALEKIREMSYADGRYNWTLQLPDFMKEEGFQNVMMEHFGDKPELVRSFNEQHMLTMEEFAISLEKAGKKEAASTFHKLIGEAYQESTTGAALCIPRIVCLGQKSA